MPYVPLSLQRRSLVSRTVKHFLWRRLAELWGGLLLLLGLGLAGAVISYHPGDPSFNAAGDGVVRNWLGVVGSHAADLLIQTFGVAVWLIVPVCLLWGWCILRHRPQQSWRWRVLTLPLVLVLLTVCVGFLPAPSAWNIPVGAGGLMGHLLASNAATLIPLNQTQAKIVVVLLAAVPALAGIIYLLTLRGYNYGRALALCAHIIIWLATNALHAIGQAALWFASHWRRSEPAIVMPSPSQTTDDKPVGLEVVKRQRQAQKKTSPQQQQFDWGDEPFKRPPLDILTFPKQSGAQEAVNEMALHTNARMLESALSDFGVAGAVVKVRPGPVVTLYEFEPAPGTKASRVIGLADDIARSMSAISVRVAVVPGSTVLGIELPNAKRETVSLRELLELDLYAKSTLALPLVLGKDISGEPVLADLARMPHLLIAGTTGSGKSVAINTMILSLLYKLSPAQCRLIMIDPKMLELSAYDAIPHLLTPVVTDPKKAIVALKWAVKEMEGRYRAMSKLGVRNIEGYNQRIREAMETGERLVRRVQTGFDPETGKPVYEDQAIDLQTLPYIVVVVDEMADLMMVAGKEIEAAVQRLAQMARAAGIHIIMATQRPSVDVITGTIKANFPTRISFQVTSKIDSRTILGEQGAEQLLGQGDMLYMSGGGRVIRVHGPFVSDREVEKVASFLKAQGEPTYDEGITTEDEGTDPLTGLPTGDESTDELYDKAVALVARERKASTSFIQRHFQIGYNRAARIVDQMEAAGVVGAANHVGKREVLISDVGNR